MAVRKKLKKSDKWITKDGREIAIAAMTDHHLANSMKMIARNYEGDLNVQAFHNLMVEAKKRKFTVSKLNTPITINGRKEYVEIFIPTPKSKIAASFFPTDWDSRPQE